MIDKKNTGLLRKLFLLRQIKKWEIPTMTETIDVETNFTVNDAGKFL